MQFDLLDQLDKVECGNLAHAALLTAPGDHSSSSDPVADLVPEECAHLTEDLFLTQSTVDPNIGDGLARPEHDWVGGDFNEGDDRIALKGVVAGTEDQHLADL